MNRGGLNGGGVFQPLTLDVDPTIRDRQLQILPDLSSELFGGSGRPAAAAAGAAQPKRSLLPEPDLPSLQVTPTPGMCVKTKNVAGRKVFLNVCKVAEIPPAPPLTEAQLQEIIAKEDYGTDYRVPLSLGAPREDSDKSDQTCLVSDVALNADWYDHTMEGSLTFTTFVVQVAMEGLCEKYGDQVNLDRQNWLILKNKKYFGQPQRHHIQQRAKGSKILEVGQDGAKEKGQKSKIVEVGPDGKSKKPLISEVQQQPQKQTQAPRKQERPATVKEAAAPTVPSETTPRLSLTREPPDEGSRPSFLVASVDLPGVRSRRELTLDLGGDRLVLEARKVGYVLDVFLPYDVDQAGCRAEFHRDKQVLTVTMPVEADAAG